MNYDEEIEMAELEVLDYLAGFSDTSLRAWRDRDISPNMAAFTKSEREELVKRIFKVRRLKRMKCTPPDNTFVDPESGLSVRLLIGDYQLPPRPNTQDERVALWNAAKEMIKKEEDVPPDGMSHHVFSLLRGIYEAPYSWVTDNGPGGRGLSWEKTLYVDELLKDPAYTPPARTYR